MPRRYGGRWRGVPRHRPPFPVTHGYLGRPTIVNNVETYADAAVLFAGGLVVLATVLGYH